MAKGPLLIFTLLLLSGLFAFIIPTMFFQNQNTLNNDVTVSGNGTDAQSYHYYKDQNTNLGITIGTLSPAISYLLIAFGVLFTLLFLYAMARRNSA